MLRLPGSISFLTALSLFLGEPSSTASGLREAAAVAPLSASAALTRLSLPVLRPLRSGFPPSPSSAPRAREPG